MSVYQYEWYYTARNSYVVAVLLDTCVDGDDLFDDCGDVVVDDDGDDDGGSDIL